MYTKPMILPLDIEGKIYALQDEKGNTIGTGTREVCEVLLYMITTKLAAPDQNRVDAKPAPSANIRSAISI